MTKRMNMTKGERQAAVEADIGQLKQAAQISQIVMNQVGNSMQNIQKDLSELANRQRELQYRLRAYQEIASIDLDEVNKKSELLQITDFDEYSLKDDEDQGLTETDVVADDSVVIFTTTAEDGKGFLRSKQAISDLSIPQLKEDLLGKAVGAVIEAEVGGTQHTLTVLGIRKKPEVKEDEQSGETLQEVQPEAGEA